jgi:hypothetical protein
VEQGSASRKKEQWPLWWSNNDVAFLYAASLFSALFLCLVVNLNVTTTD